MTNLRTTYQVEVLAVTPGQLLADQLSPARLQEPTGATAPTEAAKAPIGAAARLCCRSHSQSESFWLMGIPHHQPRL